MERLARAAIFLAGAVSASACGNGAPMADPRSTQGEPGEVEEVEDDRGVSDRHGGSSVEDEDVNAPTDEELMPVPAYGAPPPPPEE